MPQCFIFGCAVQHKYRKKHLFRAPRNINLNAALFQKWVDVIPSKKDKKFTRVDKLCSLHFEDDDIEEYYEQKMPDNSIWRLERAHAVLKKSAIPKKLLFSQKRKHVDKDVSNENKRKWKNVPSDRTKEETILLEVINAQGIAEEFSQRGSEKETKHFSLPNSPIEKANESIKLDAVTKYSKQNICDETTLETFSCDPTSDNSSDISDYDKTIAEFCNTHKQDENYFKNKIHNISMADPNILSEPALNKMIFFDYLKANASAFEANVPWWRVNVFQDFIAFFRWTTDYAVEKRIVITKELAIKVFMKDKETKIGNSIKELSIFEITKLINRVENLRVCSGINEKDRNCAGFIENELMNKRNILCNNCTEWVIENKRRTLEQLKKSKNCIELLNFYLIT